MRQQPRSALYTPWPPSGCLALIPDEASRHIDGPNGTLRPTIFRYFSTFDSIAIQMCSQKRKYGPRFPPPLPRCDDDKSEYVFENGAVLVFTYSGSHVKTFQDAASDHGAKPPSSYDAVYMNAGTKITLTTEEAIALAIHAPGEGTPFFYLSTYDRGGSCLRKEPGPKHTLLRVWGETRRHPLDGAGHGSVDERCC